MDFGRNRIFHRVFGDAFGQHALDDGAGLALTACLAEVRDVARACEISRCERTLIRSGSPGPSPAQMTLPIVYSFQLASAFTAATVMAEPPRRPFTIIDGNRQVLHQRVLGFHRADKAHRDSR